MRNTNWLVPFAFLLSFADARAHPQGAGNWHAHHRSPPPVVALLASPTTTIDTSAVLIGNAGPTVPQETGSTDGNNTSGNPTGGGISFPAGCLTANKYGIGFNSESSASSLASAAGAPPCVYGRFVDITDLKKVGIGLNEANSVNAIYMLSLKTTKYDVDPSSVAQALNTMAANAKQPVWLRLGHEMNLYGPKGEYPNDPAAFVALWRAIANDVDRTKIKMYWCANPPVEGWKDIGSLARWYPGHQYTDINGVDTYMVDRNSKFRHGLAKEFCDEYGQGDKPIFAGEIGVMPNVGTDAKLNWATQASSKDVLGWCTNYKGYAWFEISKAEGDFKAAEYGIINEALAAAAAA